MRHLRLSGMFRRQRLGRFGAAKKSAARGKQPLRGFRFQGLKFSSCVWCGVLKILRAEKAETAYSDGKVMDWQKGASEARL